MHRSSEIKETFDNDVTSMQWLPINVDNKSHIKFQHKQERYDIQFLIIAQ